ncbi:MAG: hypothetical protein LBB23_01920 [Rickettsiales bacterium]|jgi:hypothetical protein|nr:hypothetical protein [Rickettsiales bacterium]
MKKLILLLPFMLASCGGGLFSYPNDPNKLPQISRVSTATAANNAKITGMVSEIGVDTEGNHTNLARSASGTANISGKTYKLYRLDDANFKAAMGNGKPDTMKFVIDKNGKITGIHFVEEAVFKGELKRQNDTGNFIVNAAANGNATGSFAYDSIGKQLGLSYSDFGTMTFNGSVGGENFTNVKVPFAGGYEIKKINKGDIAGEAKFTGRAIGYIEAQGQGLHNLIPASAKNATLTFNAGKETLEANFSNWYDVKISTFAYNDISVQFIGNGKNAPQAYKDGFTTNEGDVRYFDTNYYGDKKIPSEATALFEYSVLATEQNGAPRNDPNYDWNLTLGFGGTRTQ